ncbi:MAG: bifunctional precorrin-2 dehydrogenase/sirohydrochlorin ferrochelatase [Acidobacteriota bacterium]
MSYPVNIDASGRSAAVIGGGAVALRKVKGLLAAGVRVTVVAPDLCPEIRTLADRNELLALPRAYRSGDLDGAFLVFAATNDEKLNTQVSKDAAERGVLVNVADRPSLCTFTLPAVVRRGDLTLAVMTEGRCPALARVLREELELRYTEEFGTLLEFMGRLRDTMTSRGWDSERILQSLSDLYREGLSRKLAAGGRERLEGFLQQRLGRDFPVPAEPVPEDERSRARFTPGGR